MFGPAKGSDAMQCKAMQSFHDSSFDNFLTSDGIVNLLVLLYITLACGQTFTPKII